MGIRTLKSPSASLERHMHMTYLKLHHPHALILPLAPSPVAFLPLLHTKRSSRPSSLPRTLSRHTAVYHTKELWKMRRVFLSCVHKADSKEERKSHGRKILYK